MSSAAASVPSGTGVEASKPAAMVKATKSTTGAGTGNEEREVAVGRGHEYEDFEDLGDVDELDGLFAAQEDEAGAATGSAAGRKAP